MCYTVKCCRPIAICLLCPVPLVVDAENWQRRIRSTHTCVTRVLALHAMKHDSTKRQTEEETEKKKRKDDGNECLVMEGKRATVATGTEFASEFHMEQISFSPFAALHGCPFRSRISPWVCLFVCLFLCITILRFSPMFFSFFCRPQRLFKLT